jgi:Major Facilitator Superfamily
MEFASKPREQSGHQSRRRAVFRSLRQLWRHRYFRRLLAVRVAIQSGDGVLQVALASYVLFSPERQPDAASIAVVLAITLLPFSIVGPFVGVVLDRVSRRQVLVVGSLARSALTVGLAALVATGLRTSSIEGLLYGGVLVAMSLNRFLLAALSASLPHTIDASEYMVANSVVPIVGPAGALIGVAVATSLRLSLGQVMPDYRANAILFVVAAAGFVLSAALALRIPRRQLGPDDMEPTRARDIVAGLVAALVHLRKRRAAGIGLLTIAAHRLVYGVVTVATILVYRNYFHSLDEVDAAIADLGLLVVITGAGFVLASVVTPPMSVRLGLPLMVAAFLLGLAAQDLKICVDTLVQAHVADEFKGRVFVLYDMIFNVMLVAASALAALILPTDGKSVIILIIMAVGYLLVALGFALASRGISMDEGTESLQPVSQS